MNLQRFVTCNSFVNATAPKRKLLALLIHFYFGLFPLPLPLHHSYKATPVQTLQPFRSAPDNNAVRKAGKRCRRVFLSNPCSFALAEVVQGKKIPDLQLSAE